MKTFIGLWVVVLVVSVVWYLRTKWQIQHHHDETVLRDRYRRFDRSDRHL